MKSESSQKTTYLEDPGWVMYLQQEHQRVKTPCWSTHKEKKEMSDDRVPCYGQDGSIIDWVRPEELVKKSHRMICEVDERVWHINRVQEHLEETVQPRLRAGWTLRSHSLIPNVAVSGTVICHLVYVKKVREE